MSEPAHLNLQKLLTKDYRLGGNSLKDASKERIYSELAILYQSNIDLKSCFEIVFESLASPVEKKYIENLLAYLVEGKSLSESMAATGVFTSFEYYSIQIGEESGKLDSVFLELQSYFERKIKTKRLLVSALTYPALVLTVSFAAITFMLKFVVPMFSEVFKRFDSDLPWITKFVIRASNIFSDNLLMIIIIFIIIILLAYYLRNTTGFKKYSSAFILKVPFLGPTLKKIYLARFCYSFGLLTSSKTDITASIELVRKMISFYPISSTLTDVRESVIAGRTFSEAISDHSIYEKKMVVLIKVGEEVNKLEQIFKKLAEEYSREVEHNTKQLSLIIEPVMIIFLGIFVGIILISMYLPLFQLGSSIGQ